MKKKCKSARIYHEHLSFDLHMESKPYAVKECIHHEENVNGWQDVPRELNFQDRQNVGSKGRDTNWPEIDEVLWKIMSRCQCQVHGACLDARLPPTLLSTQLQKNQVQNGNTNPCSTIRDCCHCHCSDDGNLCSVVQKTLQQKCSTIPLWNPQSCFWN